MHIVSINSGRFNYFKMIFQRWMRLTPALAVVIIWNKFLALNFANDVPDSFYSYSVRHCDKYWWSAILHIQVYVNPKEMVSHWYFYLLTFVTRES